jgi:hypothetical protein
MNRNNSSATINKRPQLHLRAIIVAMFEKIGYTITSAFLDSDWILGDVAYTDGYGNPYTHYGLSVDPAFVINREEDDLLNYAAEYVSTGVNMALTPGAWDASTMIGNLSLPSTPNMRTFYRFPVQFNTTVSDVGARFDNTISEYEVAVGGIYHVELDFKDEIAYYSPAAGDYVQYFQVLSPDVESPPSYTWYLVNNNTLDDAIDGTILWQRNARQNVLIRENFTLNTGDKISLMVEFVDDSFSKKSPTSTIFTLPAITQWRARIANNTRVKYTPQEDIGLGDVFRINSHIPNGIKCLDLLQDFKTMFNLYFEPDVKRKNILIEPRDTFFTGEVEDITDKIDKSSPFTLNYLTDYKNEMVFRYAEDSKDKYLAKWNKINDKTYAEYTYSFVNQSRFERGQSILATTLIAPTIQGELETGEIMSSVIKEEWLDADNAGKPLNVEYSMRVFQLVRGQQYDTAGVPRRTAGSLIFTAAIMEEFDNTPTFEDRKLTFIGERGLVWDYYTKTLANIEDTAILRLKINLSLYDFIKWDLKKTYYIDSPEEIQGYYKTDSINNFNVTKEAIVPIVLVKTKDFVPVTVTGGGGGVSIITTTGTTASPSPILCTIGGIVVDVLDAAGAKIYRK